MHQLYLHFLGAKGNWTKSSLIVQVRKSNLQEGEDTFEYWTADRMKTELGPELAADLIRRHKEEEERLPASKKGYFIKKRLEQFLLTLSGAIYHRNSLHAKM